MAWKGLNLLKKYVAKGEKLLRLVIPMVWKGLNERGCCAIKIYY